MTPATQEWGAAPSMTDVSSDTVTQTTHEANTTTAATTCMAVGAALTPATRPLRGCNINRRFCPFQWTSRSIHSFYPPQMRSGIIFGFLFLFTVCRSRVPSLQTSNLPLLSRLLGIVQLGNHCIGVGCVRPCHSTVPLHILLRGLPGHPIRQKRTHRIRGD
ncbi:hypothetical protein BGX38DRAFT_314851 [Terfezia claveryi]|nr:hypothetical protein BGX38DRAFT_314851 [Terfezia claveryi]